MFGVSSLKRICMGLLYDQSFKLTLRELEARTSLPSYFFRFCCFRSVSMQFKLICFEK